MLTTDIVRVTTMKVTNTSVGLCFVLLGLISAFQLFSHKQRDTRASLEKLSMDGLFFYKFYICIFIPPRSFLWNLSLNALPEVCLAYPNQAPTFKTVGFSLKAVLRIRPCFLLVAIKLYRADRTKQLSKVTLVTCNYTGEAVVRMRVGFAQTVKLSRGGLFF